VNDFDRLHHCRGRKAKRRQRLFPQKHFDRFIETGVTSGRFSNASEVVREGLRLLEQREQEDKAKLKWLRAAAKAGIDDIERGDYTTIHSRREMKDFIQQVRNEASSPAVATPHRGPYVPARAAVRLSGRRTALTRCCDVRT